MVVIGRISTVSTQLRGVILFSAPHNQSLGNVPPIRRFEFTAPPSFEVIDGDVAVDEEPRPRPKTVGRRVDRAGRISILKHRYHSVAISPAKQ
jgi:hypothetical protein